MSYPAGPRYDRRGYGGGYGGVGGGGFGGRGGGWGRGRGGPHGGRPPRCPYCPEDHEPYQACRFRCGCGWVHDGTGRPCMTPEEAIRQQQFLAPSPFLPQQQQQAQTARFVGSPAAESATKPESAKIGGDVADKAKDKRKRKREADKELLREAKKNQREGLSKKEDAATSPAAPVSEAQTQVSPEQQEAAALEARLAELRALAESKAKAEAEAKARESVKAEQHAVAATINETQGSDTETKVKMEEMDEAEDDDDPLERIAQLEEHQRGLEHRLQFLEQENAQLWERLDRVEQSMSRQG